MSFKLETELVVERLHCMNSPAVFWPKHRTPGGWWIFGFNLNPLVVRFWVRIVRWRVNLRRS